MKKTKRLATLLTALTLTASSALGIISFAEDTLLGDVDGDGVVTAIDGNMILRYYTALKSTSTAEELYEKLANDYHFFPITADDISRIEKLGDVNQDGTINTMDTACVYEQTNFKNGDVDCDGIVTPADSQKVLQFYTDCSSLGYEISDVEDLYNAHGDLISKYGYTEKEIRLICIIGDMNDDGLLNGIDAEMIASIAEIPEGLGDVNGDGTLDALDASLILADYVSFSTGNTSSIDLSVGDINGDGLIDSYDASYVLSYYVSFSSGKTK